MIAVSQLRHSRDVFFPGFVNFFEAALRK